MKTHWKKLPNPDYLGAYSLSGENGYIEKVVTIENVRQETVTGTDGKKEMCMVAHLTGEKPMILNATNCKAIAKVAGSSFVEDWAGVAVTLYVQQGIKAFGDVVDALRIRPKAPAPPAICDRCRNTIAPAFKMSVPQLIAYSKMHCNGATLCASCMKAFKEMQDAQKETEAVNESESS